ncbi:MAG TPA: hypothetical protein VF808_07510 [Ktedonobacterales bacterium]
MRHPGTRGSRALNVAALSVAALILLSPLAGCGGATAANTGQESAPPTPPPAATTTPAPTATPYPAQLTASAGCPVALTETQPSYTVEGGLNISTPMRANSYPSELLPSGAPNAPYKLPNSAVATFAPNPQVNPSLVPGYFVQLCNKTSASHRLTGVRVTLASFTPRAGTLAIWTNCGNGPYDAATKSTPTGCGGGAGGAPFLWATLPNDVSGASMDVSGAIWPVTIGPNQSVAFFINVEGFTRQGLYALSFTFHIDGGAPSGPPVTPAESPFIIAPSAQLWTGIACKTPAMRAQIPPSAQDAYYVCPPAA